MQLQQLHGITTFINVVSVHTGWPKKVSHYQIIEK